MNSQVASGINTSLKTFVRPIVRQPLVGKLPTECLPGLIGNKEICTRDSRRRGGDDDGDYDRELDRLVSLAYPALGPCTYYHSVDQSNV
jgi:hypothetical protein